MIENDDDQNYGIRNIHYLFPYDVVEKPKPQPVDVITNLITEPI